ncbi:HAD-IIIA family hydrolase [Dysgonomonas sp. 520]|uniref:D-glycero-alpha-D-manno-heptose-1,7-bisphosphate 7-phosphatase n=1 Tax=Dysgonomonas sp. 520 TaxID=2302931 RepID=UPI0013D43590|nr:HAD-IIIA family hydrolase [Dysgonomonas sp. 520]NDW09235.1 HAD-IIIA family hydrolase [Dysgonomonas sp. 520]
MTQFEKYKYLFLDRDGVINVERKNDYVKNISEWIFEEKAQEAIAILSEKFEYIFIITNQRGVGRGKMTENDLADIHNAMLESIASVGGNISSIYYCTDLKPESINRKPNTGMAFKAQADYPFVDFRQSVMVGNSKSDMEFGQKLGMYTVLVGDKYSRNDKIYEEVDLYCDNLYKFAIITNAK